MGTHLLQNGPKKAQILVRDGQAGVLRLRDALHPDQVSTPLTRIYYAAQLLLLEPRGEGADLDLLLKLLSDARRALPDASGLEDAQECCLKGQYFRAMRLIRPLLPEEALMLSQAQFQDEHDQGLRWAS